VVNSICPVHQVEFKLVPSGVSRTSGKAYDAFFACPERGCREKPLSQGKNKIVSELQSDQRAINGEKYEDKEKTRQYMITRQHSQEMAIRYLELKYKLEAPTGDKLELIEKVKFMTNWFMKDLEKDLGKEE